MFRLFCVVFLVLPFFGGWVEGGLTTSQFFWWTVGIVVTCVIQAAMRAPRTPQFEIFCRLLLCVYLPGLVAWWVLAEDVCTFWEYTWVMFLGVAGWMAVTYPLTLLIQKMIGLPIVNASGAHCYWDHSNMPAFLNPSVSGFISLPPRPPGIPVR